MSKKFIVVFSSILVLAIIIGGILLMNRKALPSNQDAPRKSQISLGIATWAGFGTGIVGMEKGYFPTIDLITKTLDDARARQAAFVSGDLDIMISSVDLFAQEAVKGIPGKVFLVTDESQGGDGIVAKAGIKTVADLQGRKVAYAHGGPSDYFLFKVLEDAGVRLEEVERIPVDDPSRAGEVFLSGDVDAAVTWEPFLSNTAESGKGHILITTKEKPEIIVDILVASGKFAANQKIMLEFIEGWLRSVEFIKTNPDEAAQIMAEGLNISVDDVKGMMTGLRYANRDGNKYFFDSAQPKNTRIAKLLDEAGAYWKSVGIIEEPVDGASRVSPVASKYFTRE